ncbi:MAG: response regulator [Ferruginibacter sp.]
MKTFPSQLSKQTAPAASLKRILLIEDDEGDQGLFMAALNSVELRLQCKVVNNGLDAINHLNRPLQYEMIFLDLNMPLMGGLDFLKILHEKKNAINIPVVVMTTSIEPSDKDRCEALGVKFFFHKPAKFEELCLGIENIINDIN